MRISSTLVVLAVGCGGGSPKPAQNPHDSERDAAAARWSQLDAEKPKSPLETRDRVGFRPAERCGQGPYRLETDSLRAHYGEQVIVYACGAHEISGNYRLTVETKGQASRASDSAFGFGRDNEACKGNRAAIVQSGGSAAPGAGSTGGGSSGHAATSVAPAHMKPTSLARVADVPAECKVRSQLLDSSYYSAGPEVALDGHLVVDVWSDEPNDLEGLVFVIEKRAVASDMTPERWTAYLAASDAWDKRYMALLDSEVAAGRTTILDSTVKTPPPPPPRTETPPPRPSRNARWIPGYWQYGDGSFHWLAGLWDVPPEDIAKDLTVHAPRLPPAAPAEQPTEPQPVATAVWAPGQWQWDGRGYVWISGAWRVPPSANQAWRPAGWTVSVGGAVFVPGGWHVRIGR